MYIYNARVTKVYDADTITVDIDLGFDIIFTGQSIRLYGINAPEVRGESKDLGIISRDKLRDLILGKNVQIQTIKDSKEKYGRYLGIVTVLQGENPVNTVNVNDWLVENKLAEKKDY